MIIGSFSFFKMGSSINVLNFDTATLLLQTSELVFLKLKTNQNIYFRMILLGKMPTLHFDLKIFISCKFDLPFYDHTNPLVCPGMTAPQKTPRSMVVAEPNKRLIAFWGTL